MRKRKFYIALGLLAVFALWTVAISLIDVQAIGPQGSMVGFATLNHFVHDLTGVHMQLYSITDWLGLVPVVFGLGFAILGLIQWIKRKHILKIDRSILILGGFYVVVLAAYLFFESFVINYRPALIQGYLEASYPSSTTMLVLCVMITTMLQFRERIKNPVLGKWVCAVIVAFAVFMVVGRLVSGVHWLTDIIGGAMLSTGLIMMYDSISGVNNNE